jgi:hypothetical protein
VWGSKVQKNQNMGARMFDFKIRGPKLQILQNRGTKTAIKKDLKCYKLKFN